jgi:response regulator RpfG family c-di-GMP phosphodiesterase
VLDSWVRYEQQAKENEQAELVKSVIEKVLEDLKDGKSQKEILLNAVTEVERKSSALELSRISPYLVRPWQKSSRTRVSDCLCVCVVGARNRVLFAVDHKRKDEQRD